ncbi:MAG: hypothetical protein ABEL04_04670 [Salinibacter sp.]|uniref:hypothetical protein n=1 Tax=Salinibacter sp. TaxID=2065818 RepID=UPI0035D490BF
MADAIQEQNGSILISGDHPNVTSNVVESQHSRKTIVVHVSPVEEEVLSLFAEGEGSPEEAYFEGMIGGKRQRVEVLLDKSKLGSRENFARFKSIGPPEPVN